MVMTTGAIVPKSLNVPSRTFAPCRVTPGQLLTGPSVKLDDRVLRPSGVVEKIVVDLDNSWARVFVAAVGEASRTTAFLPKSPGQQEEMEIGEKKCN